MKKEKGEEKGDATLFMAMTTAEGRSSSFSVEPQSTGDRKQVNTAPDGTHSETLYKTTEDRVIH